MQKPAPKLILSHQLDCSSVSFFNIGSCTLIQFLLVIVATYVWLCNPRYIMQMTEQYQVSHINTSFLSVVPLSDRGPDRSASCFRSRCVQSELSVVYLPKSHGKIAQLLYIFWLLCLGIFSIFTEIITCHTCLYIQKVLSSSAFAEGSSNV